MESYIFDIILITLAIVILVHLFYNNALFGATKYNIGSAEDMENICRLAGYEKKERIDSDYRDPGTYGLDRTDEKKYPWYHVANRIVENGDRVEDVEEKSKKMHRKISKLVFGDNYEKNLTSDPYLADMKKTVFDEKTFLKNNQNENYTDINNNACELDKNIQDMKRYIRDYVLDGNVQCECPVDKSKSDFTRNEVDEYRESQLEFRNKINGTSAPAVDPVDKVNEITQCGGIGATGQTIGDFYDNIVDCRPDESCRTSNINGPNFIMGTSIPIDRCVKPPQIDTSSGIPVGYYTSNANAGGKYFKADNWSYNNENPNNGGNIFDGVQGSDPLIDTNLMI